MSKRNQVYSLENVKLHFYNEDKTKEQTQEEFKEVSAKMKLRRKIEDYLRKYTTMTQLIKIADFLGISH